MTIEAPFSIGERKIEAQLMTLRRLLVGVQSENPPIINGKISAQYEKLLAKVNSTCSYSAPCGKELIRPDFTVSQFRPLVEEMLGNSLYSTAEVFRPGKGGVSWASVDDGFIPPVAIALISRYGLMDGEPKKWKDISKEIQTCCIPDFYSRVSYSIWGNMRRKGNVIVVNFDNNPDTLNVDDKRLPPGGVIWRRPWGSMAECIGTIEVHDDRIELNRRIHINHE